MPPARQSSPRLSRYTRAPRALPLSLTQRDRDILNALRAFGFLTTRQITRVVFGDTSAISYCRERLKRLFHAHCVDRLFLFRSPHGSPLTFHALKRRNPTTRSQYFLEHTLAINDFILAVMAAARANNTDLVSIGSEAHLRKNPIRVDIGSRSVTVIPDCYLTLQHRRAGQTYQMNWCVEIDRGTEPAKAFRRKVQRYLALSKGAFQRTFNSRALTVIVITTSGERRVATLTRVIETELQTGSCTGSADLFRIACVQQLPEGEALLTRPCFGVPFQMEPACLVPP